MVQQVDQVGKLQGLITENPLGFLCALLALGIIGAVTLWVRATLRVEKLQRLHQKQLNALQEQHDERVDALQRNHYARMDEVQREQLERSIKLEHLVHGVVKMVEMGAIEVRPGKRRKPRTNPGLPLEPEAPTMLFKPGGDDDES